MQMAVYVSNRVPHAALANETPYKALYGKDAHLGHLRAIGARTFVHVETHTKKLEHCSREGRLVDYSVDSKSFESTTHRRGVYVRADTSFSSRRNHKHSMLSNCTTRRL